SIALNDIKLSSPKPGSWRYNHNEHFQTFEDFQKLKKDKNQNLEKISFTFNLSERLMNFRKKK
ncbi:hypothetical protein BOQ60_23845, partial [Chryseobacterium sp. CH1]